MRELIIRPENPWSLQQLREIWDSRGLLWMLVERDLRVRYKQALLGVAWAVLQPTVQTVLFTVLFNRFARIESGGPLPYPVFCAAGLVVWGLFSSGLSQASDSLIGNPNLITKVYFPRVVLPLAAVGSAALDFAIALVVLLGAAWFLGAPPRATALLAPPIALLAVAAALAIGLWTSALNLQFRDVRHALPFVLQLLVFVTPVFYPASMVPARWRSLYLLNPMAPIVDGFRAALFGQPIPWAQLGVAAALIVAVGVPGFLRFRWLERTFADRL